MILNQFGKMIEDVWFDLPKHYRNCTLDEFIVMPNHIHGIINIIDVGNRHACSLQRNNQYLFNIIGSFKSASSKLIHQLDNNAFRWQKSFYDHIIRNEESLLTIRQYIRNNPKNWEEDDENTSK